MIRGDAAQMRWSWGSGQGCPVEWHLQRRQVDGHTRQLPLCRPGTVESGPMESVCYLVPTKCIYTGFKRGPT